MRTTKKANRPTLVISDIASPEVNTCSERAFRDANRGQLSRSELSDLRKLLAGEIDEMPCGMGFFLTVVR